MNFDSLNRQLKVLNGRFSNSGLEFLYDNESYCSTIPEGYQVYVKSKNSGLIVGQILIPDELTDKESETRIRQQMSIIMSSIQRNVLNEYAESCREQLRSQLIDFCEHGGQILFSVYGTSGGLTNQIQFQLRDLIDDFLSEPVRMVRHSEVEEFRLAVEGQVNVIANHRRETEYRHLMLCGIPIITNSNVSPGQVFCVGDRVIIHPTTFRAVHDGELRINRIDNRVQLSPVNPQPQRIDAVTGWSYSVREVRSNPIRVPMRTEVEKKSQELLNQVDPNKPKRRIK